MSKNRINIMISSEVLKKVTKKAKSKNMSRSVFIENAAVEQLNKPEPNKAPVIPYHPAGETINNNNFMVQEEARAHTGVFTSNIKHYGGEEDCILGIKMVKDFGGTQREDLYIKYVDGRKNETSITVPGKDFVDLLEKYREERGI